MILTVCRVYGFTYKVIRMISFRSNRVVLCQPRWLKRLCGLILVGTALFGPATVQALGWRIPIAVEAEVLRAVLEREGHSYLPPGLYVAEQARLKALYVQAGLRLLWSKDGKSTRQAGAAIMVIMHADDVGLRPHDYRAYRLNRQQVELQYAEHNTLEALTQFDTTVSVVLLHYLKDLHQGRVDPASMGYQLDVRPSPFAYHPLIIQLLRAMESETKARSPR